MSAIKCDPKNSPLPSCYRGQGTKNGATLSFKETRAGNLGVGHALALEEVEAWPMPSAEFRRTQQT
jgi:hypothetical protein